MAYKKKHVVRVYGRELIFDEAFHQITNINGDKNNMFITVTIFDSAEKIYQLESKNYSYVPTLETGAPNFIDQGYEYLKTLDEYSDAVAVLDDFSKESLGDTETLN